jgi:uncharacterized repeat protein (TIGR03803 family)
MKNQRKFLASSLVTVALAAAVMFGGAALAAAQEEVLHSFGKGTDGRFPEAGLIIDSKGNLYGTTSGGGADGGGMVFEFTPKAGGGWMEKVLHNFPATDKDGEDPFASLIFDAAGNLYGTTSGGGAYSYGTVFELTPKASGGWTEKVLHSFNENGTDGYNPQQASLILDAAGNLYGTTPFGGPLGGCSGLGCGTVFELTPKAGGRWTEKVLHSFNYNGKDGFEPEASLILDAAGNVYGTTTYGGTGGGCNVGCGTVFELTPRAGGRWTEKVLHSFNYNGKDGVDPYAGLIFDTANNLYGTTGGGGAYTYGTVFELTPKAGGGWMEKVLHNFNGTDGLLPEAGLISDAIGNLYGTTCCGGASGVGCGGEGCGTVFELTPKAGGRWTEKVLHSFSDNGKDGVTPYSGLISDAAGNLYGTTYFGGASGGGTVFEIKP